MKKSYFIERKCCPICKTNKGNIIFDLSYNDKDLSAYLDNFYNSQGFIEMKYLNEERFTLIKCEKCLFIYQKFIPNDFLMNKLYEEWIDPEFVKKESYNRDFIYYKQRSNEILDVINYLKKKPNNLKFLDFGMGWADWCRISKSFGIETYGMELSKDRIKNAEKYLIKVINWEELPQNKFDLINTEQVIEHVPNPLETVKHLSDSLKKDGLIKISVPHGHTAERNLKLLDWNLPRDSDFSLHVVTPLEHINVFIAETLIKMADFCDLKPVFDVRRQVFYKDISTIEFLKLKLGPYYRRIKKPKLKDTSIFFKKK